MNDVVALPRKQVKGLYRAVVGFLAATLLLGGPLLWMAVQQEHTNDHQAATDDRLEALIRSEQRDDEEEDALACVRGYAGREDIRNMAEKTYRRNAETLIAFVEPDAATEEAYRHQVDADVVEIRAELPDPDCDLEAARAVLDRAGRNTIRSGR